MLIVYIALKLKSVARAQYMADYYNSNLALKTTFTLNCLSIIVDLNIIAIITVVIGTSPFGHSIIRNISEGDTKEETGHFRCCQFSFARNVSSTKAQAMSRPTEQRLKVVLRKTIVPKRKFSARLRLQGAQRPPSERIRVDARVVRTRHS